MLFFSNSMPWLFTTPIYNNFKYIMLTSISFVPWNKLNNVMNIFLFLLNLLNLKTSVRNVQDFLSFLIYNNNRDFPSLEVLILHEILLLESSEVRRKTTRKSLLIKNSSTKDGKNKKTVTFQWKIASMNCFSCFLCVGVGRMGGWNQ